MIEFRPDHTKIEDNPFGFQEPERAARNLERSLVSAAEFFKNDILSESRLYDGWNRYQKACGNPAAIVKFTSSLEHVMELQEELAIVKACASKHVTERLERLVILLHIGLIELLEGGTSESFRQWAISSLSTAGFPLPTGKTAPEVRDYFLCLKKSYELDYGAARALREALKGGLNETDNKKLLLAWAFAKPVDFGTEYGRPRHLHCREREEAQAQRRQESEERRKRGEPEPPRPSYTPEMEPVLEYCLEYCPAPTSPETERLLPKLANRLYEMRSMIIHSASPVMFARPDAVSDEEKSGGTLFDSYFTRDGKLVMYEVRLYAGDLVQILRRCLWNRFVGSMGPSAPSS